MDNCGSKPWKKPISAQCPAHRKIQPHRPHTTPTLKGANGVYPVHKQQSVEYNRPDHWNSPSQPIPDQSWRIREDNLAELQIPQETRNPGNPTSNSKSFQWNTNTRKGWWKQNTGTANHRQWKCTTATPATEQYQPANGDNAGQTRSSFIPSAPTQQTRIERTYPPERPLPMGGGGDIEHQWIALTFKPIVTWLAPWKASQLKLTSFIKECMSSMRTACGLAHFTRMDLSNSFAWVVSIHLFYPQQNYWGGSLFF